MKRVFFSIGVAVFGATILLGCSEQESQSDFIFLEHVAVEGTCFEDHVRQPANYAGGISHYYSKSKGRHLLYGSVMNSSGLETKVMFERVKIPNRYYPPLTISISDVPIQQFEADEMHVKGLSKQGGDLDGNGSLSYESTCDLKVVSRSSTPTGENERGS